MEKEKDILNSINNIDEVLENANKLAEKTSESITKNNDIINKDDTQIDEKKFSWYTVSVISGKEDQVIEALKNKIIAFNMENIIKEIRVFEMPYISENELKKKRNGESFKVKKEKIYKGYIFIKMLIRDDSWFMVRNTQYVTGLVGSSGKGAKPTPISQIKFNQMVKYEQDRIAEFNEGIYLNSKYKVGSLVKIIDGSFEGQNGKIVENNDNEGFSIIEIEYLGRKTPVQIQHEFIEIVD